MTFIYDNIWAFVVDFIRNPKRDWSTGWLRCKEGVSTGSLIFFGIFRSILKMIKMLRVKFDICTSYNNFCLTSFRTLRILTMSPGLPWHSSPYPINKLNKKLAPPDRHLTLGHLFWIFFSQKTFFFLSEISEFILMWWHVCYEYIPHSW